MHLLSSLSIWSFSDTKELVLTSCGILSLAKQPSLGLPASELEKMTSAQKEVLVKQHTTKAAVNSDSITPEMIIKRLESGKHKEATVEKLRTCIRSELLPWTDHFLALNGHLHLFEILSNAFEKDKYVSRLNASLQPQYPCHFAVALTLLIFTKKNQ